MRLFFVTEKNLFRNVKLIVILFYWETEFLLFRWKDAILFVLEGRSNNAHFSYH